MVVRADTVSQKDTSPQQLAPALHETLLAQAWQAASKEGITGAATTPYLLDYLQRHSDGQTLEVDVEVYRNNIAVAADIARAIVS